MKALQPGQIFSGPFARSVPELRMPVTVQAGGQGKEYNILVLVGTIKEDLHQMIKDGM